MKLIHIKYLLIRRYFLYARALFTNLKFHLFFNESIANFALRLAYLSKFSQWLNRHPCQRFDKDVGYINIWNLYQFVLEKENLQGEIDYLEFGVSGGTSLNWWVQKNKNPRSRFVGFDTFTGLPEPYDNVPKGTFSTQGMLPEVEDNRCKYEIGLFQDTLFGFIEQFKLDRRTVVHIDCDLYSSALFVLSVLAPKLKKGDILIFDELGSIRHPTHEFRAFCDFISSYKFNYELLGASNFYHQVAMKLTDVLNYES